MTEVIQLLRDYAAVLIVFFVVGAVVSYLREARKIQGEIWRWLEWILVPLGYTAIIVLLQEKSVRLFTDYPAVTLAGCGGIAVFCLVLLFVRRKKPCTTAAWLGGFLGVPGLVISLALAGFYLRAPGKFQELKATLTRLESTRGQIAPDFQFTLVRGRERRNLATYRGRLVLLNVWATWCVPCRKEMPDLHRLQEAFRAEGLVVLNLSDEPAETIERYLVRRPMATTHGRIENASQMPELYQFGRVRPTSFLIARNGEVLGTVAEAKDFAYFEALVRRNLR